MRASKSLEIGPAEMARLIERFPAPVTYFMATIRKCKWFLEIRTLYSVGFELSRYTGFGCDAHGFAWA
jgi:hypothetical protein